MPQGSASFYTPFKMLLIVGVQKKVEPIMKLLLLLLQTLSSQSHQEAHSLPRARMTKQQMRALKTPTSKAKGSRGQGADQNQKTKSTGHSTSQDKKKQDAKKNAKSRMKKPLKVHDQCMLT